MLEDMLSKGIQEKQDEEVRFAKYKMFCESNSKTKTKDISDANADIEQLTATISKAESDIMQSGKEIAQLDKDMAIWATDKKEAEEVRAEKRETFKEAQADYQKTLDAVARLMTTLKSGPTTGLVQKTQTSLLELASSVQSQKAKKVMKGIMSFLQKSDPQSALLQDAAEMEIGVGAPDPTAYESSASGVVPMIEELQDKFKDELNDLEKAESEERHAHNMMVQELVDQTEAATREKKNAKSFKAKTEEAKAAAEGDLEDTKATLAEDEKFLSALTSECEQKAVDFEKRQEVRGGEIDAIKKAIEIMSSDAVSGSGDKHLPGFVQTASALVQFRSAALSPVQGAVATFLDEKARRAGSRVLSLLAVKVRSDPFKKVSKMIKDMIFKLMEEAADEAEHQGFCNTELTTNQQTRDAKTEECDSLKAEIEQLTADIEKLGTEISDLSAAVADLDAAVAKATSERQEEKAKNQATIADAKAGQEAVAKATTVLKEFYDKAATSTALAQMQAGVQQAPETFDEPYTGMGGGGVLGMMEVCQSDFARLEEETEAGEADAQSAFDEFSTNSAVDKATKSANIKHKTGMKTQKESSLATAKTDLAGAQDELNAALEYYEKLKPSCVDAGESYEERVARRKAEIESLQEALKILGGDSV
jgi:chromosome segregation ATPase